MITATYRAESAASERFGTPADETEVRRTAAALEANGFTVLRARDAAEARRIVLDLIPDGARVHHGASQTLEVTGITAANSRRPADTNRSAPGSGAWTARRRATRSAGRPRRPDVMLGSVHAVTETGSLLAASMGGSQLAAYVAGAGRVILVVGTQKIVADLEEGLRRIDEYAFPLEDARAHGGVRHPQRRQQGPDHQPRDRPGAHHRRPRRRGPRLLTP